MPDECVGLKEISEWLKLTQRRVLQLVHEDVLPKRGKGKYPVFECVTNYIVYLRERAEGTDTKSELNQEKLLTARIKRRRKELELAEHEGQLITVESHKASMAEAFDLVRSNVRNIPGTLAPRLVGIDDAREIKAVLVREIDDALRAIVDDAHESAKAQDGLPDDVPGRGRLLSASIETLQDLLEVDELTDLPGVGPKTAAKIQAWLEGHR